MVGHWPFSEQRAYLTDHPAYSSGYSGLSLSLSLSFLPTSFVSRYLGLLDKEPIDVLAWHSTFYLCLNILSVCDVCMLVLMSVLAGTVGSASAVLFGPEVWAMCVMCGWLEREKKKA